LRKNIDRILDRLKNSGLGVFEYELAVRGENPHVITSVLSSTTEPLMTIRNAGITVRRFGELSDCVDFVFSAKINWKMRFSMSVLHTFISIEQLIEDFIAAVAARREP
jgi:hypothetical protein